MAERPLFGVGNSPADPTNCAGVTAVGDCDKRARYVIQEGLMGPCFGACGIHLPQIVKRLLVGTASGVGVFRA